jgi:hypothetical protein
MWAVAYSRQLERLEKRPGAPSACNWHCAFERYRYRSGESCKRCRSGTPLGFPTDRRMRAYRSVAGRKRRFR